MTQESSTKHENQATGNDESNAGNSGDRGTGLTNRVRWLVATLLLAITAAGGVAAKVADDMIDPKPVVLPAQPNNLSFHAVGNGPVHFSGRLDRDSILEGGDGLVNMELVISGDAMAQASLQRASTDLIVVLDSS